MHSQQRIESCTGIKLEKEIFLEKDEVHLPIFNYFSIVSAQVSIQVHTCDFSFMEKFQVQVHLKDLVKEYKSIEHFYLFNWTLNLGLNFGQSGLR
jgi:hypothetical protein